MNAELKRKKYFDPDSANQMLPLVRAIVGDIVELYKDLQERGERLQTVRRSSGVASRGSDTVYSEELEQIERDLEKDMDRLQEFVDELQRLGVELKDPRTGLVDFPARIQGREAYLCWKLGEPTIAFWHDREAGFSGRQPLSEGIVTSQPEEDEQGG